VTVVAGLFLVAHGVVHIAIWVAPQPPDAPFDSHRSWMLGDAAALSRLLAILATVLFVLSGILVLVGAAAGAPVAIAGALVSLVLVVLTFHRWFIAALAINAGIIAVALM
jgi:hypothetical protein